MTLVAIAPVAIEALEQLTGTVELERPHEHVGQPEPGLRRGLRRSAGRELPGLFRERERVGLAGVEANEREPAEGGRAKRGVVEPVRELERRARVALGGGEPVREPHLQAQPLVDGRLQHERRSRFVQRLLQQSNRALRTLRLDLRQQGDRRGALLAR